MRVHMDEESVSEGTRRRRAFLGLLATVFAVTLAVVVGNRLSNEALAVIAGAVCGVGAAIPTSLIIVAVSRHRGARECRNEEPPLHPPAYSQSAYPPVVVVAPPDRWQQHAGWNGLPPSLPPPTQRDFTVVGGTPDENSSNSY